MPSNNSRYLPALTGFRAVAATMVFCHHVIIDRFPSFPMHHLYAGFLMFFVLSGYLICYQNFNGIEIKWPALSLYYRKRFARIYPIYFLLLTLVVFYEFKIDPSRITAKYLVLNYSLLKGWFSEYIYSGIGQAWTLTLEETFYFLCPFIFILLRSKKTSLKQLVSLSLGIGTTQYLAASYFGIQTFDLYALTSSNFFFLFSNFAIGIFFAQLALGNANNAEKWLSRFPHQTYIGTITFILCLLVQEIIKGGPNLDFSFSWGQYLINSFVIPFSIGLLLNGLYREQTVLKRILASKIFVELGKASYVFYLIHHGPIAKFIEEQTHRIFPDIFPILQIILIYIFLQALSILIYTFLEHPIAKYLRNDNKMAKEEA